jgi:two-component system NtrC family sensor kinase
LIAIFISILIANALVKPIKALAKSTKRVAQGKLDEHISVKREDELGELVFSFNDMIRKLRDAKNSERLSIVGKAAASIVHELKNSLVMVNTLVGLFPKKHKDARFIENFSKTMPQELERWRTMLQDLSDFSRGARIDLWFTDVDIARLIGDIRCLIEERVSQNNIELNVSVEKGLPRIKGNAQKLKQVLMNLVTNAIDAMPGGGALNLCVSMDDKINNRQKIRYVEIKIEDTGRGIPQEDYERIFEPFYTTKADGIGLGLAISRNIIQQHGGDIKAESRLNQGSCFVIILPANQTL